MIYVPKSIQGRTGYLVMVDRFCRVGEPPEKMEGRKIKEWKDSIPDWQPDSDGEYRNRYFYGGNLKGIASKIDYFDKLGVDLVFLSPISRTNSYHHYDVHDQRIIDPYIGDWNDFSLLAQKLNRRNKLLGVDLVFNHRAADSEFFQRALAGEKEYKEWFMWDEKGEPIFWYDFRDMPQCDKMNLEYQEFCCEEARTYVRKGADVIRLDLGENFPREFMLKIGAAVREINPNVVIVNEMWNFALFKENPQIYDNQANSVMNYPLGDAILRWVRYGNYLHFNACIANLAKYPMQVHDVLLNYLSTHDTPRERTMLAGEAMVEDPYSGFIWDIEKWWRTSNTFPTYEFRRWEYEHDSVLEPNVDKLHKQAVLIQYLMKGVPVIFYGSEIGMCGYKDPFPRKPYPWGEEDLELLSYYNGAGLMRSKNKDILATGDQYATANSDVLEIVRRSANGIIVGLVNRSNHDVPINASYPKAREIFSLEGSNKQNLRPYGAYVCRF